jgi:hypothetical protein
MSDEKKIHEPTELENLKAQIMSETHLGDGLYASFDGYQIKLRAPRLGGDQEVFLEPGVLKTFKRWEVDLEKQIEEYHTMVKENN